MNAPGERNAFREAPFAYKFVALLIVFTPSLLTLGSIGLVLYILGHFIHKYW